ncbi:MAG: hypothetical protein QOI67_1198 [Gaiellaceae bacterium]|jgi:hypothetical protein|nr:hypothetical protein [Gaiellaceae bacterium]
MKGLRLAGVVAVLAVGAGAASVDGARAGLLSCMDKPEKVFAPWGDNSSYTLAPNGSLEGGSSGWSLSGARVIPQSNTLRSGQYSLSLPSGSSATSPTACVKLLDPASRFFLRNTGASDGKLRVDVTYKSLLGLLTLTSTLGYVQADGSWQPSPKYTHALQNILGTLALNRNLLSAQLRFKFTPTGRGASFEIDDLFVDPLLTI